MKNNIKYLFLIFLIMFICNLNVSASEITDYCYYNFTGLAPSGDAAQDAIFEVDIYDGGVYARGKGLGDFADIMHEDPVINWGEETNSFDSKKYYDSMGKSCPPYAIFYSIGLPINDKIFLSDYDRIAGDQNEAFFTGANKYGVFLMKLIDISKDTSVKETCDYRDFTISYNDNNEVIKIESKNDQIFYSSLEMSLSSETVDLCQPIKSCEYYQKWYINPLGDQDEFASKHKFLFYSDTTTWSIVGDCATLEPLSNKSTTTTCIRYSLFMNGNENENIDGLKDYWTRYKECLDNNNAACAVEEISNYNNKKDILKSWCNTILSNNDYDNSCVQRCLELNNELLSLEGTTDPNNTGDTCGLSKRLVSWILNIIKWVKYIIPAILVILGIIDFIRAVASDKDDEMKKAQGRFIKRLIAAALIFIVPFILEFVLDKMGFEVSSCGIIRELD